jgi:hypothetical protein
MDLPQTPQRRHHLDLTVRAHLPNRPLRLPPLNITIPTRKAASLASPRTKHRAVKTNRTGLLSRLSLGHGSAVIVQHGTRKVANLALGKRTVGKRYQVPDPVSPAPEAHSLGAHRVHGYRLYGRRRPRWIAYRPCSWHGRSHGHGDNRRSDNPDDTSRLPAGRQRSLEIAAELHPDGREPVSANGFGVPDQ